MTDWEFSRMHRAWEERMDREMDRYNDYPNDEWDYETYGDPPEDEEERDDR
jgi:hypothetical protein